MIIYINNLTNNMVNTAPNQPCNNEGQNNDQTDQIMRQVETVTQSQTKLRGLKGIVEKFASGELIGNIVSKVLKFVSSSRIFRMIFGFFGVDFDSSDREQSQNENPNNDSDNVDLSRVPDQFKESIAFEQLAAGESRKYISATSLKLHIKPDINRPADPRMFQGQSLILTNTTQGKRTKVRAMNRELWIKTSDISKLSDSRVERTRGLAENQYIIGDSICQGVCKFARQGQGYPNLKIGEILPFLEHKLANGEIAQNQITLVIGYNDIPRTLPLVKRAFNKLMSDLASYSRHYNKKFNIVRLARWKTEEDHIDKVNEANQIISTQANGNSNLTEIAIDGITTDGRGKNRRLHDPAFYQNLATKLNKIR